MTEELTTKTGRLTAALIAGPAVTAGMLGLGMAPVSADAEQETDSVEVVEEAQGDTVEEGRARPRMREARSLPPRTA
ncbi:MULTISPECIES: hypothetical protein [Actinomycetes]|uniref:Uncharacterized protein n=2 Tax=Actinomycetes TaxID=1760 RepID=A0ABP6LY46_9MICC